MIPKRILIVEDERAVLMTLRALLVDEGYEVLEAPDGEQALAQPSAGIDLVLCDLRLPGIHGLEVCRTLRQRSNVPIIVVSAHVDSHDVVAGLEAGADDYVTKPFVPKELTARIRAALRRASRSESAVTQALEFGDLVISSAQAVVTNNGARINLTATEFRLLCELAEHAGLVLTRDQLLESVWGYDYLSDSRVVDAHIRRLREKLEVDPSDPRYVITVRGLGYRFER